MRVLAVTTMRDEGPFILEWVAHHRALGVTDFLIYSNDCRDGTDLILDALAAAGIVTHVPQVLAPDDSPQWTALRAAWRHPLRKACDWAVVCDVDEFIVPHRGITSLPDLIQALPLGTDAVAMPWRLFGSNGVVGFADRPVLAQFTASAPPTMEYPVQSTFPKSLFRLEGPFNNFGVHRPKQKGADGAPVPAWVDGGGVPLPATFSENQSRLALYGLSQGRDLVECHHYSLRSAESFLIKRARGLPNRSKKSIDLGYWMERNFNAVTNNAALRFLPAMEAARDTIHGICGPDLLAHHKASVAWHQARFLGLVREEREFRLYAQAALSPGSRVLPKRDADALLRLFHAVER